MARRVRDYIEISEFTSLDRLIDYLKAIRDHLPEDAEPELRLKGDDALGRRLTISYSRALTSAAEAECDARAVPLPESEEWIDDLRAKLDKLP